MLHGRGLRWVAVFFTLTFAGQARAFDWYKFTVPVSGTASLGGVRNDDYFLNARVVNSFSVETMPSYPVGIFRIGSHFEYSIQRQLRRVTTATDTNLRGSLWTIGIGAKAWFTTRFYGQLAIDLLGKYNLSKATETDQEAAFKGLMAAYRIKTGYRMLRYVPRLTLDLDFAFLRFRDVSIAGATYTSSTREFMAGLGVTYRFGSWQAPKPEPVPEAAPPLAAEQPLEITMPSTSFNVNSATLREESLPTLKALAEALAKNNFETVSVTGYTDTSGLAAENQRLSQARADSVKAYLVGSGVEASRISAVGLGDKDPIASNADPESRARNRRVQIRIEKASETPKESTDETK